MSVSKEPLNIRNNNPGNLRFAGQEGATPGEGGFARFESREAGLNAMRRQIELDTQKRGMNLNDFINKYAPPSENKTQNYVDFVANRAGLDPRSTVPAEKIADVQRAMVEMEGGPRSMNYFYASSAAPTPAPAAAAPKPEPTRVAQAPRTTKQDIGSLPDNYRAALAANYLADTEEESITEKAMELLEASGQTGGGSSGGGGYLAKAFPMAGGKAVDPFQFVLQPEQEQPAPRKTLPRMPRMMAEGGEAKKSFGEFLRDEAAGPLEAGATLATGALSGMVAPFYGVYKNLTSGKYGTPEGVRIAEEAAGKVLESGTYMPRSERGQEMLQTVGKVLERSKVPPLVPEAVGLQVAPGAARFLKDKIDSGPDAFRRTLESAIPQPQAMTSAGPIDLPREPIAQAPQNLAEPTLTYAVKPGGGVVDSRDPLNLIKGNVYNQISERYEARTGERPPSFDVYENIPEGENLGAIQSWLDSKGKTYFEKQYGSPNDPLLKAFEKGSFTPRIVAQNEEFFADMAGNDPNLVSELSRARALTTSDNPADQVKGRQLLTTLYDQATPITTYLPKQAVQNRLINPQYRDSIAQYIREEMDLGFDDLKPAEMDAILDGYASTGVLSSNAPFFETQINEAVTANVLDTMAKQIKVQGGMTGARFGAEGVDFDGLRGTALGLPNVAENIRRGEPIIAVDDAATSRLFSRQELVGYMLDNPKETWENLSLPELVLKVENSFSKTTDPFEVAKRIDNYRPVTKEQRLMGSAMALPLKDSVLGKGAHWREITDTGGVAIEGRLLKHCLSEDEKYANFLENDLSKFFGLRDKDGKSYATIQIDRLGQDQQGPVANVRQIKGYKNKAVGKEYEKEIMSFLRDYESKLGVPLRYTEAEDYLPPEVRPLRNPQNFAKGGMVDKPLYDRAR